VQGQLSSSEDWFQDGEAAPTPGCLSVLLFPPFSALLFGSLLFFGLTQIRFASTLPNAPMAASEELAPFFAPSVLRWETDILAWSAEQGLDPNLVATVMQIESCGDPRALSHAGASGLFQVMPYHFAQDENEFDPQTNAVRGLNYLSSSLDAFANDASMALAGYNVGINGASQPRNYWAQETIDYQYWGKNIYADAAAGSAHSPVLDEWMAAGGASLCAQAERSAMALH
jgi:soluble lytic murein transglycosylase-like protein